MDGGRDLPGADEITVHTAGAATRPRVLLRVLWALGVVAVLATAVLTTTSDHTAPRTRAAPAPAPVARVRSAQPRVVLNDWELPRPPGAG